MNLQGQYDDKMFDFSQGGLRKRIASWRSDAAPAGIAPAADSDLAMAKPEPATGKLPETFSDVAWKKMPIGGTHRIQNPIFP
ncbi:MAG: hypothetical protein MUF81_00240 [Verrucomicrobia bacterium]|jgi:hypothetical protein|nr:hypothetical protein [Verrucomicrobiota bacterium]